MSGQKFVISEALRVASILKRTVAVRTTVSYWFGQIDGPESPSASVCMTIDYSRARCGGARRRPPRAAGGTTTQCSARAVRVHAHACNLGAQRGRSRCRHARMATSAMRVLLSTTTLGACGAPRGAGEPSTCLSGDRQLNVCFSTTPTISATALSASATSADACCSACLQTPQCCCWTYSNSHDWEAGGCELKHTLQNGSTTSPHCVSGNVKSPLPIEPPLVPPPVPPPATVSAAAFPPRLKTEATEAHIGQARDADYDYQLVPAPTLSFGQPQVVDKLKQAMPDDFLAFGTALEQQSWQKQTPTLKASSDDTMEVRTRISPVATLGREFNWLSWSESAGSIWRNSTDPPHRHISSVPSLYNICNRKD